MFDRRHPVVRRVTVVAAPFAVVIVICAARFGRGSPAARSRSIIATPLLASAIEHTLGNRHRVEIGGTQIERDSGPHVASHSRHADPRRRRRGHRRRPKAEVAVSTTGLLMGSLHAKRVSLVGAELAVRIETDGQITISPAPNAARSPSRPRVVKPRQAAPSRRSPQAIAQRSLAANVAPRWPGPAALTISRRDGLSTDVAKVDGNEFSASSASRTAT